MTTRSMQTRLLQWLLVIQLATMLVVGLAAFFTIRANAYTDIGVEHRRSLDELQRSINNLLEQYADDARFLANSPAARAFVAETMAVGSSDLSAMQTELIEDFVSLAQQRTGSLLEIRYVTQSGSVWTTVKNVNGIEIDPNVYVGAISGDETLATTLRQLPNTVILGALQFRRDAQGQRITPAEPMLRFSVPVPYFSDSANIPGVIQIDMDARPLFAQVNTPTLPLENAPGRRVMLVNSLGQTLGDSLAPEDTYPSRGVAGASSSFSTRNEDLDVAMRNRFDDFSALQVSNHLLSATQIDMAGSPAMPWRLLMVDDAAVVLAQTDANAFLVLAASLVFGGLIALLTRIVALRTLRPLAKATVVARQLTSGQGSALELNAAAGQNEPGELVQALHQMAAQVDTLSTELNTQMRRYNRNLETAAHIGREVATLRDLGSLLNRSIHLIVNDFGFSHAQVFLVDEVGENAVLAYSYGDAGHQLLAQGHRLAVGSNSVIGRVTQTGQPVVVNDTQAGDAPHRFNPLLPETRSEMALPLQIGATIIGALDIQSNMPDAFQPEEMQTYQLLADQIAVAIQNARLLDETEARVRQIDRLNRQLTSSAWQDSGESAASAYRYDLYSVEAGDAPAAHSSAHIAAPIAIRGQVVGSLAALAPDGTTFAEGDEALIRAVSERVGTAIETARLFEQARRRAHEMSFLFGVTTAATAADTLSGALQNVADELRQSLGAASVSLYLPQFGVDGEALWLQPVALAGSDQPLSELSDIDLTGDDLMARSVASRTPVLIGSIDAGTGYLPVVDEARSAVIVPLTLGQQIVGLITVESDRVNAYDDDTLTLLRTLSGTLSAIIQNQQLLEQMQRTNEQLRALDRLKSDFLANMSHELRTPLNSIIGFSRVILKGIDGPLTEMQEQDLTTIHASGQHLLNLINDILDQAKISANRMEMQLEYFSIKTVIDPVRSMGIGLVKDKPIDILVEIDSGLPDAFGDEFRTRQILLNLVSNAAKFTREGTITLRVYPVTQPETGATMLRVDVTDTGIGIAEKDLPLLFEAFRQVDSSLTRTVGGTGLGLPIAKSLVEMQGGEMFVESRVNVGSTFSITLPTEAPEGSDVEAPDEWHETGNGYEGEMSFADMPMLAAPMLLKRQILLIEDNPEMVDQFRRALQREGYDIFAASIPLEAEAMASGLHPTIIVMDVNFADGQGWSILEQFQRRDDTRDIPVVVVTLSDERERAEASGAFRFIPRPFLPETLVEAVQEADYQSRMDRILIIDDEPESARLLEQILQQQGDFRVFSAYSAREGIALVARRRPNLVILDLRMPEMDGFAVAEELRANPETASIPIVVVTGETLTADERERLAHLDVHAKTDISLEAYFGFLEGVKTHLARSH